MRIVRGNRVEIELLSRPVYNVLYFQVLDIYDCTCGLLKIGPFNYEPLRGVDLWLEQPDEFILQHLSTAPDVEPPHFVSEVRFFNMCKCGLELQYVWDELCRMCLPLTTDKQLNYMMNPDFYVMHVSYVDSKFI